MEELYIIVEGNPGAVAFLMETVYADIDERFVAIALIRMEREGITGEKLYMLWNDCCDRDTYFAIRVMLGYPIEKIKEHINYENGRGIPFTLPPRI